MHGFDPLCHRHLESCAEAATIFERCWTGRNKLLSPEHLDTLEVMLDLASIYQLLGKFSKAKDMERQCRVISERVFGTEHPLVQRNCNSGIERERR